MLVVEHDPIVGDLIARALEAAGYHVSWVRDSAVAIQEAMQAPPDSIIVNLEMPGLSGKDLMIALTAQRIDVPVVVLARKGMEADIIQAYRLGVADYLLWPVREAEVLTVIERVFKQGRTRREREMLAVALQKTNQELQSRLRSMRSIFAIGKAILSIKDQSILLDRILENATFVARADVSWLLLRAENQPHYLLSAYQNLPDSLHGELNQPWDDGVSTLVARSGKALNLTGDALRQFRFGSLGQSILILPILVHSEIIGLMALLRRQMEPFNETEQAMLEAICDYASLALVNARLFKAIDEHSSIQDTRMKRIILARTSERERSEAAAREMGRLFERIKDATEKPAVELPDFEGYDSLLLQKSMIEADLVMDLQPLPADVDGFPGGSPVSLAGLATQISQRFQALAHLDSIQIFTEFSSENMTANIDPFLLALILEGLLSNAVKFNRSGGQIVLRLQKSGKDALLSVTDTGGGIASQRVPYLFEPRSGDWRGETPARVGGPGISLARMREIARFYRGEIELQSKPGKGVTFTLRLPLR